LNPKFADHPFSLNMHMHLLIAIKAVKEKVELIVMGGGGASRAQATPPKGLDPANLGLSLFLLL
jgi:hypothetical protein